MQQMGVGSSGISATSSRVTTSQHTSPQGGGSDRWSQMDGVRADYVHPLPSEQISGKLISCRRHLDTSSCRAHDVFIYHRLELFF